ncbi:Hypothetical predicted protein [Paramuricea clavata]|uniref:Uncharacterized protein n=1 Tax=Paramuricea clavata TaxID=317549 RepID=A0A6S7G8F1_PARCT|nr:Hypothetical predicted protein [Paramuricea clavata]
MNVDAFDSKQRFKDSLRIAYDSGTFLLGMKVSSFIVLVYYTYLKEDYEKNEMARQYFEPECMGYQSDNYWIISNDVHVSHGNIIGESEIRYIMTDDTLQPYQLEIGESLFDIRYLKKFLQRFYSMSIGFGQKTVAFQMATAFTVGRIIRNALAPKDVWRFMAQGRGYVDE